MSAGRVSMAYRELGEIPPNVVSEIAKFCRVLDLTSNLISDLYPLRELPLLEELILDDNKITSHTKFPPLPKLQTLWVNRNQITHLTLFIDKLVASCPTLIILSMLNNEACPNYFNSGTPAQYQDYRYYVINRLTKLQVLDSTPVSPAEREEAHKKYGSLTSTSESEASRRAAESAALAKKRAEKEERLREKSDEAVRQRREAKKAKKGAVRRPAPVPPSPSSSDAPPPPPTIPKAPADGPLPFKLPDLPPIDTNREEEDSPLPAFHSLPPIPPPQLESHADRSQRDPIAEYTDNVDWDDDDSDWSDSE